MMNSVKQHIPNCVSGVEPKTCNFSNIEDLQDIPFIKRYMEMLEFTQLSVADNGKILMAEYDNGKHWWCIGYFETPVDDLPKWKGQ